MVKELLSDQVVREISSDLQSEAVRGLTNPTGSEPVKLVEKKKRKTSAPDFALGRFNFKTKKTRYKNFI